MKPGHPLPATGTAGGRSAAVTALSSTNLSRWPNTSLAPVLTPRIRGGPPKDGEEVHNLRFDIDISVSACNTDKEESELTDLSASFLRPQSTFGLDHRIQFMLEEEGTSVSRKPFYRLSQEPIIYSNWKVLSDLIVNSESALEFASLLAGKKVQYRSYPMWARGPIGHFVYFEQAPNPGTFIASIREILSLKLSPLIKAVALYYRVVSAHPFDDGNGRFARAIFYSSLARMNVVTSPCLALSAILDCHREEMAKAAIELSEGGYWTSYIQVMLTTLQSSIRLVSQERQI